MIKQKIYNDRLFGIVFREVSKWLNAAFAARVLLSDITFLTPTVKQTEPGSPTSVR